MIFRGRCLIHNIKKAGGSLIHDNKGQWVF